jgi:hypothetical protein
LLCLLVGLIVLTINTRGDIKRYFHRFVIILALLLTVSSDLDVETRATDDDCRKGDVIDKFGGFLPASKTASNKISR